MNRYTQLTEKQRCLIEHFVKAGFSQTEISNNLGVHKSTISRELRRNSCSKRYRAQRAQSRADEYEREQGEEFHRPRQNGISSSARGGGSSITSIGVSVTWKTFFRK